MPQKYAIVLLLAAAFFISGCTETDQKTCVAEGGTIPVIAEPPECCGGLTLILPKDPNIIGISGICTAKCGNGVCDETESSYNCEDDCPKPAPTCEESGGTCRPEGCSGIEFEIDLPVSDCPNKCCVCCKEIIPECVPAECCHPTDCVLKQLGPDCSEIMCTAECRPGTFDCGCGSCEFDYSTSDCRIVWSDSPDCYME